MLGNANVYATIAVKDIESAREFYEQTLGLSVENDSPGGILYTSGSTKVFVYPSQYAGSNQATTATWTVNDLEACVNELRDKGVSFEHYQDMPDTELQGDIHVMGDMKAAWFKDPDDNILNLTDAMNG